MNRAQVAWVYGDAKEAEEWSRIFAAIPPSFFVLLGDNVTWNPRLYVPFAYEKSNTLARIKPASPLVVIAPATGLHIKGETSLYDFTHPPDALYLFGANRMPLIPAILGGRTPVARVFIPTEAKVELHSHQAALMVLLHRRIQLGY